MTKLISWKEPYVYRQDEHKGWGNSINFDWGSDMEKIISGNGWLRRLPMKGDHLLIPMTSGKYFKTVFTEVKRCIDPPDMFFFKAKKVGYSDIPYEPKKKVEP